MNQGAQGYRLTKKTEGRKSLETVPLSYKWGFMSPPEQKIEMTIVHVMGYLL
jgi:hypothetical protein